MEVFTVSLFGHRKIYNLNQIYEKLFPIIKELLQTKQYVAFFIGRSGEFDEYAASVIKIAQKEFGKENNDMTLVLPYKVADIEYYENYYDDIIIPPSVCGVYPKAAIKKRNQWMVEESDLVLVYVEREEGGAYDTMKYAEKINKRIIRL